MIDARKTLTAVAAATALLAATASLSTPAQAEHGRNAAIIGGLAAGALVGGALANGGYNEPGYARPAYGPAPVYDGGDCHFERQRVVDEYGNYAGTRRVRVCD